MFETKKEFRFVLSTLMINVLISVLIIFEKFESDIENELIPLPRIIIEFELSSKFVNEQLLINIGYPVS